VSEVLPGYQRGWGGTFSFATPFPAASPLPFFPQPPLLLQLLLAAFLLRNWPSDAAVPHCSSKATHQHLSFAEPGLSPSLQPRQIVYTRVSATRTNSFSPACSPFRRLTVKAKGNWALHGFFVVIWRSLRASNVSTRRTQPPGLAC